MGPRYNKNTINVIKIVHKNFHTYEENYMRALQIFREIYWESLRAPDRCITLKRNPYRRQKLNYALYGKTKEERTKNKEALKLGMIDHKLERERDLVEEQLGRDKVVEARSAVKRDIAKRR